MSKCKSKTARAHRGHQRKKGPHTREAVFPRQHFSHSALKQLQTCPLQYRLQRIDRVKPSQRSPSLVLGGVYHQVIAAALRILKGSAAHADDITREALRLWFDDFWAEALDADGPPIRWTEKVTPRDQRDLGQAMIAAWYDQGLPLFAEAKAILGVEMPFCVDLVRSDGRVLRTPLAGIIDAVVRRKDGTVTIIDHKTSRSRYSDTQVDLGLQPTAYTYAAKALGHGDCVFEFHTMLKKKVPQLVVAKTTRDEDAFDRLFWVAEKAERLLESGALLPAAPSWLCDSCEYRAACAAAHRPVVIPVQEPVPAA